MPFNLRNRDFLKEIDFTTKELKFLLDLSRDLKRAKYDGTEVQRMKGKNIALIFEKTSTRTRCAFEVGAYDQGARVTYLDPNSSQIGHKESAADTARVLSRFYDAIEFRGSAQATVETLAEFSDVPVYNGLTDEWHPTQMLADFLTMIEHGRGKPVEEISYAYLGDARSNMGHSLYVMGAIMGADVRIVAPKALWPSKEIQKIAKDRSATSGARLTLTEDVTAGVKGVDYVHTDVWVSMGEAKEVWDQRVKLLTPYQVNTKSLKSTGNPNVKFLHCLPAFHNRETVVGEDIFQKFGLDGLEVTDDVFESKMSVVFDEAENRLHSIKAVMVATLGS